eukprot:scaffold58_cov256-Pinguiococcus_pyrenoidosus.AAC.30
MPGLQSPVLLSAAREKHRDEMERRERQLVEHPMILATRFTFPAPLVATAAAEDSRRLCFRRFCGERVRWRCSAVLGVHGLDPDDAGGAFKLPRAPGAAAGEDAGVRDVLPPLHQLAAGAVRARLSLRPVRLPRALPGPWLPDGVRAEECGDLVQPQRAHRLDHWAVHRDVLPHARGLRDRGLRAAAPHRGLVPHAVRGHVRVPQLQAGPRATGGQHQRLPRLQGDALGLSVAGGYDLRLLRLRQAVHRGLQGVLQVARPGAL